MIGFERSHGDWENIDTRFLQIHTRWVRKSYVSLVADDKRNMNAK